MNEYAIYHQMDSNLCFPVSKNELVLRLRTAHDDIKTAYVLYESKYVIHNRHKKTEMVKAYSDGLFDWFEVKLKLKDTRIGYVFYVNDGENNYYFSEDGISETYDFKLGYYNFFQFPYINEADMVKPVEWMKSACFYQIFAERFNRGIKDKDDSYINLKWGEKPSPKSFAGGDIPGITDKLSYIKGLGCNAIYLTPVFTSVSNHKYDISDYYTVDPQFGTNEDLKELVREAHNRGMKVVLDAVFNHASSSLSQFRDVCEKGKKSEYYDWFIVKGDTVNTEKPNYEMFAFCRYMPKFNTSNKEVQDFLIDIAVHYIREYDIDGWRLDVSDEISHDFWRRFRTSVKEVKEDAVILGENWHNAYANLKGDEYDGIMNYAFTKTALDYFAFKTKNAEETAYKLNAILMRNKDGINRMMLNLLDSHDTHRFYSMVNENRGSMKSALALLYFFMGSPCLFYGDEILTPGGYDPDCRRCMDWEKTKKGAGYDDIKELLKSLSKLHGTKTFYDSNVNIFSKNDCLYVKREGKGVVYLLVINETDNEKEEDGIKLLPHSFVIRKNGGTLING